MHGIKDLRLVEIEVHDFCNRKCSFCPNAEFSRCDSIETANELNFKSFSNMIFDLNNSNYSGVFSFSRYNEPFAKPKLLERYVNLIRTVMPLNKIVTNTNGDYIDREYFKLFDEVTIMDYGNKGSKYWEEALKTFEGLDTKVEVFLNFRENATIEDRGGTVSDPTMKMKNGGVPRTRPCYEPQRFLGIDANGSVMGCCNVRSDTHPRMILGNINERSIIEIDASPKADLVRNQACHAPGHMKACEFCQKDPGRYTRDDNPGIDYKGERQ